MVDNEPHNPLLRLNDVTEVWHLANILQHEVKRVRNTLHHCDMDTCNDSCICGATVEFASTAICGQQLRSTDHDTSRE